MKSEYQLHSSRWSTRLMVAVVAGISLIGVFCIATTNADEPRSKRNIQTKSSSVAKTAQSDRTKKKQPLYTYRSQHDPNGIGKFYLGREIAHVMGFGFNGSGAKWLERSAREKEEKLTLLVKSLKLKPGDVVADIGAGSGVLSLPLAEQVGSEGQVLAVDVQQEMLDRLSKRLKKFGIGNVKLVKGTVKSPRLKPASVDLAIMVDVYHEFDYPYEMILSLSKAIKPGGRVVFVEYRKEDPSIAIKLVHKMTEAQVKKEIGQPAFGLKWKETIEVLPIQHIIIFEKMSAKKHHQ